MGTASQLMCVFLEAYIREEDVGEDGEDGEVPEPVAAAK